MSNRTPRILLALLPIVCGTPRAALAGDPPQFRLTILPTLEDADQTRATAMDEVGRVVGFVSHSIFVEAAYWQEPTEAPLIATGEGAGFSIPNDINASGFIVGLAEEGGMAFVWSSYGPIAPLLVPGPCCPSANAINDANVVVGFAAPPGGGQLPVRWVNWVPEFLGLVAGDVSGYAMDVNDDGHVVGQSGQEAAFWLDDTAQRLPVRGPVLFSIAHELNDLDEVVGEVTSPGAVTRGVVWRDGVPQELPSLGGALTVAYAVNNSSWIVGMTQGVSSPEDVNIRAGLWIDDEPFDLNVLTIDLPPGLRLVTATDVNDAGMIIGEAFSFADGGMHAFLLEPVSDTWTDLGQGLPGSFGPSLHYGLGTLEAGTPVTLALAGAGTFAPTTLVLGFSALEAPFKGGVLVPFPSLLVGGLLTNDSGELALSGTCPAGAPAGASFYSQFWMLDFAGWQGFTASNGLRGTMP